MPKEGDEMSKFRKRYIILAIILLIECIAYGSIRYKIEKDYDEHLIKRDAKIKAILKESPDMYFIYREADDMYGDLTYEPSKKLANIGLGLVMLITLNIANRKIKNKKLKWILYVLNGIAGICLLTLIIYLWS